MKDMLYKKGVIILNKKIICLISFFILIFGTVSFAKYEPNKIKEIDNIETINAEDIGIETIEVDEKHEQIVDETEIVSDEEEIVVDDESIEEEMEEEIEKEIDEPIEEEIDESEPPAGMCEGYESGVYLPVNSSCELHEECHRCEQCVFEEEIFCDDEINPDGEHLVLNKTCIICGHGTCTPIDESEIE